jgi:hypothetical protein
MPAELLSSAVKAVEEQRESVDAVHVWHVSLLMSDCRVAAVGVNVDVKMQPGVL